MTGFEGIGRPDDDGIWASIDDTLRHVLLPALDDDWARVAAVQLIGLVDHARTRPADPTTARMHEIADCLDGLVGNQLIDAEWTDRSVDPPVVLAACSRILARAVGRVDPDAAAVRSELRPRLVRHLDEDLSTNLPLLDYFRGRLPHA